MSFARLKLEPGLIASSSGLGSGNSIVVSASNVLNQMSTGSGGTIVTHSGGMGSLSLAPIDCYEDMFKEITKKLYGEDGLSEIDATQNIVYDTTDAFRTDGGGGGSGTSQLIVTTANGLPPGTFVVQQRRIQDDKGVPQTYALVSTSPPQMTMEERWFESDETLNWTTSKIARYNPGQKVFRCVDCDFVGFLSRVAEHWLGNHASLRVFQCPRCPYTSAWARCVRMHLTRQHGETLTDNSLWKENPVLEEVSKYLNSLKTKVETKPETIMGGEKRYTCQYCPYATDRRDLFNRHENIHREEKPFQCYICDKQFNRADHVKKHFMRMHKDDPYDINKIRKHLHKVHSGGLSFFPAAASGGGSLNQSKTNAKVEPVQIPQTETHQIQLHSHSDLLQPSNELSPSLTLSMGASSNGSTLEQIPHIAFFNPPPPGPGASQSGPLQGIQGVGGTKKEAKAKGSKKKKVGEKMYSCSYCPWQGVDNWCLKRHLNTHIKPFLCALCDYKAARSERLATHVLKVHNKRVCHKCSYLADDTDALNQHILDAHQNPLVKTGSSCNVCQEYFELRADLEAHAILEHQKVIVQCDLCDFRTTDELSMESHLREKHNLQPGMGAVAAAAAAAAAAVSHNSQPHMQTLPPQQEHQQPMQPPQIQMPEPSPQSQEEPEPQIIVPDDLGVHLQDARSYEDAGMSSNLDQIGTRGPGDDDLNGEEGEVDQSYLCETCGFEFNDETSLKTHELFHFPPKPTPDDSRTSKGVSKDYICAQCSYSCPTRKIMMQHWRVHTGFLQECQERDCQYTTPFSNNLKEHILTEHSNDSFIRCPHCALKMTSINCFTIHWRFHHTMICSLCVNLYKTKYSIKEPVIHELVLRSSGQVVTGASLDEDDDDGGGDKKVLELDSTPSAIKNQDLPIENTPNDTNNNSGEEPPSKKQRMDSLVESLALQTSSTTFEAYLATRNAYKKRDKIRFLPKLMEYVVKRHKGTKRKGGASTITVQKPKSSLGSVRDVDWKEVRALSKRIRRFNAKRRGLRMVHSPLRRIGPIVENNRPISGFRCYYPSCFARNWKYTSKKSLILHELGHRGVSSRGRVKCDSCEEEFPHLYNAILHKMKVHPDGNELTQPCSSTISSGMSNNQPLQQLQEQGINPPENGLI